jgi:prophage regulatory protein
MDKRMGALEKISMLRLRQVKERTGLSRSGIYQRISEGTFPKQISLGARSVGWIESEIEGWIIDRISQSRCESARHSTNSEIFRNLENQTAVL